MVRKTLLHLSVLALFFLPILLSAQVLGPCGVKPSAEKGKTVQIEKEATKASSLEVNPIPLPGQRAIDFELTAVVGNEIKTIRLSDYQGKWRVICFFPAAFTFV